MFDTAKEHGEICDYLKDLFARKNATYGNSVTKSVDRLGLVSAASFISIKFDRMVNLLNGAENKVPDDSFEDTLLDLANYSIIMLAEYRRLKSEREDNNGKSDILPKEL